MLCLMIENETVGLSKTTSVDAEHLQQEIGELCFRQMSCFFIIRH